VERQTLRKQSAASKPRKVGGRSAAPRKNQIEREFSTTKVLLEKEIEALKSNLDSTKRGHGKNGGNRRPSGADGNYPGRIHQGLKIQLNHEKEQHDREGSEF